MSNMYAEEDTDGLWKLRQESFRGHRFNGHEHPHDVCAVARTMEELKTMVQPLWPDTKWPETKTVKSEDKDFSSFHN